MAILPFVTNQNGDRRALDKYDFAALIVENPANFKKICEMFGISEKDLTEQLLDANVERCPKCKLWDHGYSLVNEKSEPDGYCDACRPAELCEMPMALWG